MFKLAPLASILRTVTVHVPSQTLRDGADAQTFVARFRVLDRDVALEIEAKARTASAEEKARDPHPALREALVGWEEIVDEQGELVPFSAAARDRLLTLPYVATALYEAYYAGLSGQPKLGN